jgi:hypothetical protein
MPGRVFGALLFFVLSSASAMAWNDMPLGEFAPATDEVPIWAYPSEANHCPAGLQPVVIGGVVSCGTPNRVGYAERKQVTFRGSYVATGKGAGEGYYIRD